MGRSVEKGLGCRVAAGHGVQGRGGGRGPGEQGGQVVACVGGGRQTQDAVAARGEAPEAEEAAADEIPG